MLDYLKPTGFQLSKLQELMGTADVEEASRNGLEAIFVKLEDMVAQRAGQITEQVTEADKVLDTFPGARIYE
jgi:hypothetical protein